MNYSIKVKEKVRKGRRYLIYGDFENKYGAIRITRRGYLKFEGDMGAFVEAIAEFVHPTKSKPPTDNTLDNVGD